MLLFVKSHYINYFVTIIQRTFVKLGSYVLHSPKNTNFLKVFMYCPDLLAVFSHAVAYVASPKLLIFTQRNKEWKHYPLFAHLEQ